MIYQLTEKGRSIIWSDWCKMGGCGLCGYSISELALHFRNKGEKYDLSGYTLGEIAGISPLAGRILANFSNKEFHANNLSVPLETSTSRITNS